MAHLSFSPHIGQVSGNPVKALSGFVGFRISGRSRYCISDSASFLLECRSHMRHIAWLNSNRALVVGFRFAFRQRESILRREQSIAWTVLLKCKLNRGRCVLSAGFGHHSSESSLSRLNLGRAPYSGNVYLYWVNSEKLA
jgi:hypothetical protein